MSVAMRMNNGLHHAVSMGTIDSHTKPTYYSQADRNYESEDENTHRRRLRHTSSTELYPKPSQYSRGDIREQYCLTDRQVNTIERSRRDKFFGCLSRRSAPQSLLGGCVGRRVPSDENLAPYTPFYKYSQYNQQYPPTASPADNLDMDGSYFRRQPASILCSSKMVDTSADNRKPTWVEQQSQYKQNSYQNYDTVNYINDKNSYHCPSHIRVTTGPPITPSRTKHVSFARSHTLTSFDDFNVGFRSSGRMKTAQSQERLIGGKKLLGPSGSYYDNMPICAPPITAIMGSTSTIHMLPQATVPVHQIGHTHQHHLGHIQPTYIPTYVTEQHAQTQQPTTLMAAIPLIEDMSSLSITSMVPAPLTSLPPPSPEVIIVEKKFRNAMKTQATQTDVRKNEFEHNLALSPRTIHRVKVVSQGAQTNGLQNGKPLAKSLSQIPYDNRQKETDNEASTADHEVLCRTQSEEPSKSPLESNFNYYQPPPPLEYANSHELYYQQPKRQHLIMQKDDSFSYESNSLPRRACGFRLDTDFHSLPRRDMHNVQDVCKHITECSELMADGSFDFTSDLLPPPQEYCHNDDDDSLNATHTFPKEFNEINRRKSMLVSIDPHYESPFRRDDIRRQSMPIYVKTEKLLDLDYVTTKTSRKFNSKSFGDDMSDEKEIIIDFKPYIGSEFQMPFKRNFPKTVEKAHENENNYVSGEPLDSISIDSAHSEEQQIVHVYENLPSCVCNIPDVHEAECSEQEERYGVLSGISAPQSPLREEPIGHTSTYLSSDSLANDVTKDHSDSHWNESEVTVLTAEQRSEASYNSNLLLTPSTKRKKLLLQHQQRSSVDTDALDLEEQFTDQSPTFSQTSLSMKSRSPVTPQSEKDLKPYAATQAKIISPSIEITPSFSKSSTLTKSTPKILQSSPRKSITITPQKEQRRLSDISVGPSSVTDLQKSLAGNADISECSTNTNTEEYATCTDTSRQTAGMRATLTTTTTSSSSTTQVPASAQSSQMDKSHGESSFESASSLYSSKAEMVTEDVIEIEEDRRKSESKTELNLCLSLTQKAVPKKSPTHSISSTSSGSYNARGERKTPDNETISPLAVKIAISSPLTQRAEHERIKMESISDDEKSEMRYSSSGYYESPQDDDYQKIKSRRHRQEEERKRRKTSMKIDIEKENMRALTSPIKKEQLKTSPERPKISSALTDSASPVKIKRFRPKMRRQMRRPSRDESITKQRKPSTIIQSPQGNNEKLQEVSIVPAISEKIHAASSKSEIESVMIAEAKDQPLIASKATTALTPTHVKSASETCQLKAKSIESLNRSVSPGSDSVFYSEADGNHGEPHSGHCSHCGKEVEEPSVACGDSVESLPYIDNEPDIVKPPSDFADSPVASKTPQRLYKKMDKRFRSDERYYNERGRHYKSKKENVRAKSEERNQECYKKTTPNLRATGSSPCILPEIINETKLQTIYVGHYEIARYARLTDSDIWAQLDHQALEKNRDRRSSTESEKNFYSKYQVILHRLVQRRCTLEMYHRQKNDTFGVDKTVVVKSDSGEFGFRIHGSKPVVVAAIEPDTPAESSGLEVGDIIISVNGVKVLDKHHTEVVKIAHDGCEKLELEVARTLGVLLNEQQEPPVQIIYSGYLWRQSGQAKGSPNTNKWVQRWFVLRSDNCLYYYKTEEDTQPVGAMIMAKHIVDLCPPKIGRSHAFKVDSGEGIPMYVAADNEELANHWLNILKKAANQENQWLDKSARNLYKQPSSISRPDCFGYLMKLGSKWCGWSKRYCVLKDACLYFFQDVNSKSALGMVCLHGYKVCSMSVATSGKKNSFEIVPPEPKLRHYYFYTESEMEKKRWISALEYSIDRWIKSG